jgi:hypothetical protein
MALGLGRDAGGRRPPDKKWQKKPDDFKTAQIFFTLDSGNPNVLGGQYTSTAWLGALTPEPIFLETHTFNNAFGIAPIHPPLNPGNGPLVLTGPGDSWDSRINYSEKQLNVLIVYSRLLNYSYIYRYICYGSEGYEICDIWRWWAVFIFETRFNLYDRFGNLISTTTRVDTGTLGIVDGTTSGEIYVTSDRLTDYFLIGNELAFLNTQRDYVNETIGQSYSGIASGGFSGFDIGGGGSIAFNYRLSDDFPVLQGSFSSLGGFNFRAGYATNEFMFDRQRSKLLTKEKLYSEGETLDFGPKSLYRVGGVSTLSLPANTIGIAKFENYYPKANGDYDMYAKEIPLRSYGSRYHDFRPNWRPGAGVSFP